TNDIGDELVSLCKDEEQQFARSIVCCSTAERAYLNLWMVRGGWRGEVAIGVVETIIPDQYGPWLTTTSSVVPDDSPPNSPTGDIRSSTYDPNGSPCTPNVSPNPPIHQGGTTSTKPKYKVQFNIPDNLPALVPDFDFSPDLSPNSDLSPTTEEGVVGATPSRDPPLGFKTKGKELFPNSSLG
ncbi:hypothetical protein CRG98_015434, partial [Punica granatum]